MAVLLNVAVLIDMTCLKGRGARDQIANIQRVPENHLFLLY